MSIQKLTCESISNLDNGLFGRLVDSELSKVYDDLDDRGHDGLARELTIKIKLTRDVSRNAEIIAVDPLVQGKLPPLRSNITAAKIGTRDGELSLLFRDDNADNPDQPTLTENLETEAK